MTKPKPGGWRRWVAIGFVLSPIWIAALLLIFFTLTKPDLERCYYTENSPEHCVPD